MAKCKKCGKSGLFLKLSSEGLCKDCDKVLSIDLSFEGAEEKNQLIKDNKESLSEYKPLQKNKFNSELSIDELEVLVKFLKPIPHNYLESLYWRSEWEEVSNKSLSKTIHGLLRKGYIEPPNTEKTLDYAYKVSELKDFCRERELKISGKKSNMIERLISNDEKGMAFLVKDYKLLVCSDKGNKLSLDYFSYKENEKLIYQEKSLQAIRTKDFILAIKSMIDYESNQYYKKGINFDWKNEEVENYLLVIKCIYSDTPKFFHDIPEKKLEQLRDLASFSYLWRRPDKNYFSEYENFSNIYSNSECIDLLVSFAKNKIELQQIMDNYRDTPLRIQKKMFLKILTCNDEHVCEECKKIASKNYSLDEKLPEIPNPSCTSNWGCRCHYGLDIKL